jgi:hypothetical protein
MSSVASASSKRRLVKERLEFLASRACWRDACDDLRRAYSCWRGCLTPQRPLAFANYRAALDWEEHAARLHADSSERLRAASNGVEATTGIARQPGAV